uniref:Putative gag polyprotein n=1 Tax=Chibugado virus TaxID=2689361 RepID=A0A6B9KG71_9VIRU|nr:putative gag polyprotein [Chibugado virus]
MTSPAVPAGSSGAAESAYTPAQQLAINNFSTVGKLSDFVKELAKFDGKPTELISWITDVEGIFDLYRDLPKKSVEYGILTRSIRRKIIGEASDVLNANNVFYDWETMKSTLLLYYKDKRDLKTLDFELTTIKKAPSESLSSYFSRVNELLALIIVQVQTDESMVESSDSHIKYFREKALDSFIRGLEAPLSIMLKTAGVTTLSKAYQFCLDYKNIDIRSAPFRNEHSNNFVPKPRELELPQQRSAVYVPPVQPRMRTRPTPMPRMFRQSNHSFTHQPQPIAIDQSIRSNQANYGNNSTVQQFRPNNQLFQKPVAMNRRPNPFSSQYHQYQRQAHPIEQDEYGTDTFQEYYYTDNSCNYPEDNFHDPQDEYYPEQQMSSINQMTNQQTNQNQRQQEISQQNLEISYNNAPSASNSATHFLEMNPSSNPGW